MLRLMLLATLLLGALAPSSHAQMFGRRFEPAPPVYQPAPSGPVKQWLDALDPSGRPAKVFGWREGAVIRYEPTENPHMTAAPTPAPAPSAPTGPTVNYGVNVPRVNVGEATHTNDQRFAESVISEQEHQHPSPGGLFDRLKPKPRPCPGPGPCPDPDSDEVAELPADEPANHHTIALAVAGTAVVVALLALAVAVFVGVLNLPKSPREAPLHVGP